MNISRSILPIILLLQILTARLIAMDQKTCTETKKHAPPSISFELTGYGDSEDEAAANPIVKSKRALRKLDILPSPAASVSTAAAAAHAANAIAPAVSTKPTHTAQAAATDSQQELQLEDFFGDRVPNAIDRIIYQLDPTKKVDAKIELTNALLLYGPAGTGKTSIAKLIAKKAGRQIEFASGGDFRTKYQGSGKKELEALFKRAQQKRPVVIIIDEIDGTATKFAERSSSQEDNRALKILIKLLDAHTHDPGIFVIGTTNHLNKIDAAIKRRFACVNIPAPSYDACLKIARYYLKKNNFRIIDGPPIEADNKHIRTGFLMNFCSYVNWYEYTGNDIMQIINNAARDAYEGRACEISSLYSFSTADLKNYKLHTICFSPFLYTVGWITAALSHMLDSTSLEKHMYSNFYAQKKAKE